VDCVSIFFFKQNYFITLDYLNKITKYIDFAKLTRKRAQNAIQEQQQRLAQHRTFLHHPYPPQYLQMANQNQNTLNIAQYPGFPQHNVSQSGNQFINTTPSISRVTQMGYSSTTRIEID
jgi:hypothetical protein